MKENIDKTLSFLEETSLVIARAVLQEAVDQGLRIDPSLLAGGVRIEIGDQLPLAGGDSFRQCVWVYPLALEDDSYICCVFTIFPEAGEWVCDGGNLILNSLRNIKTDTEGLSTDFDTDFRRSSPRFLPKVSFYKQSNSLWGEEWDSVR